MWTFTTEHGHARHTKRGAKAAKAPPLKLIFPPAPPAPSTPRTAGLLAAVAGHDLIAAVLTGPYNGGLGDALVLDAGDHSPHFLIVADLERVVLEGVEVGQLQIDDLLVPPAGRLRECLGRLCRLLGLGRFLRLCCLSSQ